MRPRLVTYNLASLDGRLTLAPGVSLLTGDARWTALSAPVGDPYEWVRAQHDPEVLLEGSGSFLAEEDAPAEDGPLVGATHAAPGAPIPHFLPAAVTSVPGRRWFAVVDGRGRVDLQFTQWPDPAWANWHALVLTSHAAPPAHLARLRERGIPYLVVGDGRVDLVAAMELLASVLGVRTVVCTGGGRLGGALLRAGLVDEIDVDLLPAVIGGRGTPALFDAPPLGPDEVPVALELLSAREQPGGWLRLRYAVRRPDR
ncbi:dihydrofolate reductase family protein [Pengzhenrongella frigida]|uniref:Deaminase n=1 Tax=Pengzhenrongella frigida TaxID=1259133 RepID=A0A4Q5N0B2_9MICO|nr:dihydrofolate reductase family protein [Cellulomonas sp. HLT2-17]RYV51460.1 deaminase [Cellulomonas sp. HLT2-17]